MKIAYLDGFRFFRMLQVGAHAIIKSQNKLDSMNVFPVADADTGINMAMTMEAVLSQATVSRNLKTTLSSVADAALMGARGNSGIILAQYLHGLSAEVPDSETISALEFAKVAQRAVSHLYRSIMNPVEGTILTVIREWSEFLTEHSHPDFVQMISGSLARAQVSLKETPHKLKILADAKVVDAGASGFVIFLEAVVDFLHYGSMRKLAPVVHSKRNIVEYHSSAPASYRFCLECLLGNCSCSHETLKELLSPLGDSLILAGGSKKLHIHIHSNNPESVFESIRPLGDLSSIKVDDMKRQYETSHEQKFPIGILTDSACDLPDYLMDRYQISRIAFGINFGKDFYLDRDTLTAENFYRMLQSKKPHPQSSQPSPQSVQSAINHMAENYNKVFAIHISSHLSGIYQSAAAYIAAREDDKVHLVDSKQLSVSEGLLVLRVARSIEAGLSFGQISSQLDTWIRNTHIYTDINTLKYMVRGGRVPPLTGILAAALNLKPIVGLDREGKAQITGKSFSRAQNMKKILAIVDNELKQKNLWEYAIVHAEAQNRAEEYGRLLTRLTGKSPAYIMPLSPVVGVHNGIGAVGIGVIYDTD